MPALLAITIALILYGTLAPFHFDFAREMNNPFLFMLRSWPKLDRAAVRDAVLNVAMFVPLGLTACLTLARRWHRGVALLGAIALGTILSASIEVLQVYDAHRVASSADWLCNTLGAMAGAVIALVWQRRIEGFTAPAGRRGAGAGIVLGICWIGTQLYPFLPEITRSQLGPSLRYLLASHVSWVGVTAGAASWFAFALALRAVWGRLPWAWLALTMFVIPLRLSVGGQVVSKTDVVAALIGLLLWCVTSDPVRPHVGWVLMAAAIVLRELAPFHFPGPLHGFSWVPFGASLAGDQASSAVVILRKAFEYGAMVWLLRGGKASYLRAGIGLAAALGVMEAMQCWMPGRTPEITDPILALLMALVLWIVR